MKRLKTTVRLFATGFVLGLILTVAFPIYSGNKVSGHSISGSIPLVNVYILNSPTLTVSRMSVEDQIRTTLRIEGLGHLSSTFIKVAFYESTMNPRAVGYASNEYVQYMGLFQISSQTWKGYSCEGDSYSVYWNTTCAVKIYRAEGGFNAWHVYTAGLVN